MGHLFFVFNFAILSIYNTKEVNDMEKNRVCGSVIWKRYNLRRAELITLIEYLTHKEMVDIHMISQDTGIPEMAVLVCVNRLQSRRLLNFATPVPVNATCDYSCYYRVTDRLRKYSKNNEIALNML